MFFDCYLNVFKINICVIFSRPFFNNHFFFCLSFFFGCFIFGLFFLNKTYNFFKAFNKFFKIFPIEENFMFFILKFTIVNKLSFAFRNGNIKLITPCTFYIKKIRSFTCSDYFRINFLVKPAFRTLHPFLIINAFHSLSFSIFFTKVS